MNDFKKEFMNEAIQEAILARNKGEIPIGAVIVKDGIIISRSERSAGSALRGKPTADRRPHPLCVVQPLGRAQQ